MQLQFKNWEKPAAIAIVFAVMILIAGNTVATPLQLMGQSGPGQREIDSPTANRPSPAGALLRSFIVPGWGHYYADPDNWRRGQYHLGADIMLAGAFLMVNRQAYVVEKNMYTHAGAYSGIDIRDRDRQFELAVGNFRSLDEYNDYQERTRNLNRLYPDTPDYQWNWESENRRIEYRQLRSRRDILNQQVPALVGFMVVNRVISSVSAYSRARDLTGSSASFHIVPGPYLQGFKARLFISF